MNDIISIEFIFDHDEVSSITEQNVTFTYD